MNKSILLDTYIEELGTLYLLQYELASQKEDAKAWYFFFNEFSMSEFSKEDYVAALEKYIKMSDSDNVVASRSLSDDFSCIINTLWRWYCRRNHWDGCQ